MRWFEWKSSVNLLANRSCSHLSLLRLRDAVTDAGASLGHFQLRGVEETKEIFGLRLSQTLALQREEA